MATGKASEAWNHTSSLMALLASINADPKSGKTFGPADFHPFLEPPEPKYQLATPELLAQLGFRQKPPEAADG